MWLQIRKSDNRIIGYATIGSIEEDEVSFSFEVEVEEDADLFFSFYNDGEIVFDESLKLQEENLKTISEEKVQQQVMFNAMQSRVMLMSLNDDEAYSFRLLYDEWVSGIEYEKGDRVMFQGLFYKCIKEEKHVSNDTIDPLKANYIWVEIPNPNDEWPEWKQPFGYSDAYSVGDKVTFEGKHYISKIYGNVYSPTEYPDGWDLQED